MTHTNENLLHQLGHLLFSGVLGTVVGGLFLVLGADSLALPAGIVVALLGLASMVWFKGSLRRYFLILLFLVAPFDLSKAVVPPLDEFYSPGLYLSIGHVVLLGLLVSWGIERLLVQRVRLQVTRLDALAFIFLGWIWVSALMAPGNKITLAATAVAYSLSVLAFYAVSHAVQSMQEVVSILKVVVIGLILQTLHVVGQMLTHNYLPLPGSKGSQSSLSTLTYGSLGESAFRPVGAFDHPNSLADYLTLLLIPALALALLGPSRLSRKAWLTAMGTSCVTGLLLLLTLSRGAWAAAVLGILALCVVYWRLRLIGRTHLLGAVLAGSIALGALVSAYPQIIYRLTEPDDRSTESRLVLNDQAFAIIKANPITGVGFGSYNRAAHEIRGPSWGGISKDYQDMIIQLVVHNHYLLVAAQMGIPALLFWCYLLYRMAAQAWPVSRWRDTGAMALGIGLGCALISQMLFLASDNYDVDIRVFLLWLTAGLLQALTRLRPLAAAPVKTAPTRLGVLT
ncbi:MAG: O-antigen ligase family protein [Aquabacterium sp.]|nr:O-antigen ligase family protein [Aquabacterium sp.]